MSSDKMFKITKQYLEMSEKEGADEAFDWLTRTHPMYVDDVLDYLDEFLDVINKYYKI